MPHLIIKNIGPIHEIAIDLKKINIFIGPQSCGNSTIAKIISFCQWLEKESILRQNTQFVSPQFVTSSLLRFHNISDFFQKESEIEYAGNALNLQLHNFDGNNFNKITVTKTPDFNSAVVSKTAYIPADRNTVFIPGILSVDLPKNYLRSFLTDWDRIRRKFDKNDRIPLLDIGESYYFNESTGMDNLVMKNGKDLPLAQASSGIQSVTPLYLYLTYLTKWIYTHEEDKSVEKTRQIKRGALSKFLNINTTEIDALEAASEDKTIDAFLERIESRFPHLQPHFRQYEEQVGKPHFSNIVIEEPEQNLFPQTQAQLIFDILKMLNHERDNLVITTHSPFILYAVNNCLLAYLRTEHADKSTLETLDFDSASFINPNIVAVWEIRDGYIEDINGVRNVTIQNEKGLIGTNYFDRVMGNIMADFHNLL